MPDGIKSSTATKLQLSYTTTTMATKPKLERQDSKRQPSNTFYAEYAFE
jgi:hypothetical protein